MIINLLLAFIVWCTDCPTKSYPLQVKGSQSAVQALVQILNAELPASMSIQAQPVDLLNHEYGISLVHKTENQSLFSRQGRFQCTVNYLLGDSTKVFKLQLVEDDPRVLIGDGEKSTVDMTDITKFNVNSDGYFTAGNVLLHELYEQFQLQVIENLVPGEIKPNQLRAAHMRAIQKESNLYSLTMLRTDAIIEQDFIRIEYSSRIDSKQKHYHAYYKRGNIQRIEKVEEWQQTKLEVSICFYIFFEIV